MKRILVVATAIFAAGALLIALPAIAQDSDRGTQRSEQRAHRWADHRADFAARLGAELGIDADRVEQALATVRSQLRAEHQDRRLEHLAKRLDQAVADDRLTREQADAILEAAGNGVFPEHRGSPQRRHGTRNSGFDRADRWQAPDDLNR
jgi:hypothetical protein